ncbi:tRNA (adenosine(37)-N6)-threonylcarbamoyltransferase complex dimerization subunit type 1 TsaB [candidate division GN15 bacterium]|uniref:tRNA (Adenosine(37)-N6)-threonylcarbamoyltransferase complex dimerization subunit type 1 TsaB n=1 Tax=candidate division GN15 bacterium TaxID=2072418 RepID=A0A855WVB1_9BACT|nr:MAG: tRNA (adenosine(37)-N6)-threonylcarbamoyltransferase complex dimerization subunit type 1 TsaB [candidate division GN15 bacterium]
MSGSDFDNLLAIDTSSSRLKLALSFGGDRLVKSDEDVERSHGQIIIRKIENLISSSGLQQSDVDGLIVSTGPGSFTGLRIGLAAAKGIAVALNIPVLGISLFELAAWRFRSETRPIMIAVQVRRDELLIGSVREGRFDLGSVSAVPLGSLRQHVGHSAIIGVGFEVARHFGDGQQEGDYGEMEIDPADLIHLGRPRLIEGERADLASLEPLYIQKSQAEIRFEQRRQQS